MEFFMCSPRDKCPLQLTFNGCATEKGAIPRDFRKLQSEIVLRKRQIVLTIVHGLFEIHHVLFPVPELVSDTYEMSL